MRSTLLSLCAVGLAMMVLPAHAKVVAVAVSSDGARIELHDQAGPCVGAARMAEHVAANGHKTAGCWLLDQQSVKISFLDGERGDIPLAHLKQVDDAEAGSTGSTAPATRPARSASRADSA